MSAFTPAQLAYLEAHKNDSRVPEIHWVYSVPIAVSIISTGLRLWAKKAGRNGITLDDYLIVFATICLVGECSSGLGYGPPHGMGRHVTAVSPEDITTFRKGDYVFSHFYDIALASVKLAILAFYHRVFVVPVFQKIVLATAAFVLSWAIAITVTLLVVCRPLEAFWDDNVKGECLNIVTFTYFTNVSNLITDIWIFLMPIPVIWSLQLPRHKKLLLCFVFSIGLATCVVSSIRLTVVLGHGSPDITWATVPLGAYSVFEPLGGILATNLPIIWHMYRKHAAMLPSYKSHASDPPSSHTHNPLSGNHSSRRIRFRGWSSIGLSSLGTRNETQRGDEEVMGGKPERWLSLASESEASQSQAEFSKEGKLEAGPRDSKMEQSRPTQTWIHVHSSATKPGREDGSREESASGVAVESEVGTEVDEEEKKDEKGRSLRRNIHEVRTR